MNAFEWSQTIASWVTVAGVFLAAWQIWLTCKQAKTQFEDELASQYRELVKKLPIGALFGDELSSEAHQSCLPDFHHYFDLTNEEVFLRIKGRIRKDTWADWREGIRLNLERPAFARAWAEIKQRSGKSFQELRKLEEFAFDADPKRWGGIMPWFRRLLNPGGSKAN